MRAVVSGKVKEERKARVLRDAGFDMDLDGTDSFSIQYQNANNSVRVRLTLYFPAYSLEGIKRLKTYIFYNTEPSVLHFTS